MESTDDTPDNKSINKKRVLLILSVPALLMVAVSVVFFAIIQTNAKFIIESTDIVNLNIQPKVAIVFGGGVAEDGPLPIVQDRLDMAKKLYDAGSVSNILVSGDNRFLDYNEPSVMQEYLIQKGISADNIQPDFAGRSTYETCERARKIFGITEAILVSESTHLPRAIYLCKHFGVTSYGVASDGDASSGLQLGQRWREVLARNKAVFNVYILGEDTVLGEKIDL